MTNKEMFDLANAGMANKNEVSKKFQEWCRKNGKMAMNPNTIREWWSEEWDDL